MTYLTEWEETEIPCRSCLKKEVETRVWESSCGGYEDDEYRCNHCGWHWWVDGPDA